MVGAAPPVVDTAAIVQDGAMYVLGGQDFNIIPNLNLGPIGLPLIPVSNFFSDVWSSTVIIESHRSITGMVSSTTAPHG